MVKLKCKKPLLNRLKMGRISLHKYSPAKSPRPEGVPPVKTPKKLIDYLEYFFLNRNLPRSKGKLL